MAQTVASQEPCGDLISSIFAGVIAFVVLTAILLLPVFYFYRITHDLTAAYWTFANTVFPVDRPIFSLPHFDLIAFAIQFVSILLAAYIGRLTYLSTIPPVEIHISGRTLLEDNEAIDRWHEVMGQEEEWGEKGSLICKTPDGDELTISQNRETMHTVLVGSSGSGKTTILRNKIDAIRERGDRILLFDNKSDFTSTLPNGKDILLVAPWDSRGWAWDVAKDFRNKTDAQALAAAFIVASDKDPMWANSAKTVFTAVIIQCQKTWPLKWGWGHVTAILSDDTQIQAAVFAHQPQGSVFIADMESNTTQSILTNLQAFMVPLFTLADAWDRCKVNGRFSIKNWLDDKGVEATKRTLIIQGHGAFEELQTVVTQSIIYTIKRHVTSPSFSEINRPSDRRINLFFDEFKQLGRLEGFASLLEVGRSKGVRVLIALQDIHQLYEVYSKDIAQTWLGGFGTHIIGGIKGVETSKWLSDMIGQKRIKVYTPSYSHDNGRITRSDTYQEQDRPVVNTDQFSRILKTHAIGARLLIFTGGDHAFVVDATHLTAEQKKPKRKRIVEAAWTKPDWPTALDAALAVAKVKEQEMGENEEERENGDKEIISGGIEEKLVEEVGAKLDAYMELTGEPISVTLTFAHHAIEIFSLVADVSSGINKSRPIRTVIIPPHPSIEDEEEEFTNI